jgi:alanyl-tRNA synthetase
VEAQRERAGAADAADGTERGALYQRIGAEIPPIQFVGYESLTSPAKILTLVRGTQRVQEAAAGEEVEIILDRTPAYAESGGQMGDTGSLVGRHGRGEIGTAYYRGGSSSTGRVRSVDSAKTRMW